MELQQVHRNPMLSQVVDDDDDDAEACIAEIERREADDSNLAAVGRLFGSNRSVVVDKSSIYQRCNYGKKLRIGALLNPMHPRMKLFARVVSMIGYAHSYYTAYDVAFGPVRESITLLVIDQLVNIMFSIETFVQCRTALYLASSDVFVADSQFIRNRFTSIKMLPRLLHIVPLEVFHFALVPSTISVGDGIGLRLLRLFKLIRLKQLFMSSESSSVYYNERKRWFMLLFIFARFACVSHLIACFLYGLSMLDDPTSDVSYFGRLCGNWGLSTGCQETQTTAWLYVMCLYYAVTITSTVGFGNIMPFSTIQLLAHICFIIIGALHNAIIIAKVVETVEEFSREQREYGNALSRLNDFTETRHLSEGLRQEIKRHFDYQWSRTRCIDERDFLNGTSPTLRLQISHALYFPSIKRSTLFREAPEPFIIALLMQSSAQFVRKNEFVYSIGHVATCLYVVLKGTLQEFKDDALKESIASFAKHDCFGLDIFVKTDIVRTSVVRAETNSDVLCIEHETLLRASQLYADVYQTIHLKAINLLNRRLNTLL